MRIQRKFLKLTSQTYPYGTEKILKNHLPRGYKEDIHGNFFVKIGEDSNTMFTCHLDTAGGKTCKVNHIIKDYIISTDGTSILGADDKAGMVVLLYMIEQKIPGLYYFFIGEEHGCVGSTALASKFPKEFSNINKVVSFDRCGDNSIITSQLGSKCCSNEFGLELAKRLNLADSSFSYVLDPTGVYTDSAEFVDIIPECTNISVGYWAEHTTLEKQDISHLIKLCSAVCEIDWESLPIVRKPGDDGWTRRHIDTRSEIWWDSFDPYDVYGERYCEFDNIYDTNPQNDYILAKYEETEFLRSNFITIKNGKENKQAYIATSRIKYERRIIEEYLDAIGIGGVVIWNGDTCWSEANKNSIPVYIGNRLELENFIPELKNIPEYYLKYEPDYPHS